ncbi:outer membrane lipoprotein-sorting protein [bacterium]|nr:outer membrane lipoprotein-sorting protein [bacterium]
MICFWIVFVLLCQSPTPLETGLSATEILARVDDNYVSTTKQVTSTMIIHGRRSERTVKALSYIQGMDKAYTEYLFPEREKGTKMLKLKNELWLYSPDTDRTVKIAGHMLRRSVMGSDLSYEDYLEDPELSHLYQATLDGSEKLDDRDCYVLQLTAKTDDIAYFSRRLWVDRERFIPLKEQRFAKSGKLLKELTVTEVFRIETRWYPRTMTFKDVLQSGLGTEFIIDAIEFDPAIPDSYFSTAALR